MIKAKDLEVGDITVSGWTITKIDKGVSWPFDIDITQGPDLVLLTLEKERLEYNYYGLSGTKKRKTKTLHETRWYKAADEVGKDTA